MNIEELRKELRKLPKSMVFPVGFANPHSWRGSYDEPSVEPAHDVSVKSMLNCLDELVTEEFYGYKGGEYRFSKWQNLHLDAYGEYSGEVIGPVLFGMMLWRATHPA